jgi:hypothetical protein
MSKFQHNGIWNEQVFFTPNVTIKCVPPYVQGKPDTCWVTYSEGRRPALHYDWERRLGMSLIRCPNPNCKCQS